MIQQYITEKQVAERFAIGLRQLRKMRVFGTGPRFTKISGAIGRTGGRVVYAIADVLAWIASRPSGGESALEVERPL